MTPHIPVHLDPTTFTEIDGIPESAVAGVNTALSQLRAGFNQVANARADILDDPTMTEDGRLVALDSLYQKQVASKVDGVFQQLESLKLAPDAVALTIAKVFEPSADAGKAMVASEIRAALSRMDIEERYRVFQQAADSGDLRMMTAVLSAPSFLSGINAEVAEEMKAIYIQRHRPDLHTLHTAAQSAAARAQLAIQALPVLRRMIVPQTEEARLSTARTKADRSRSHLN